MQALSKLNPIGHSALRKWY